jgi:hypothetical protein
MSRSIGRLLLVLLVVVVGCAGLIPAQSGGALATITTRGGKCVDGPCGSTVALERDGRLHMTAPRAEELGDVDDARLAALAAAIASTDFEAMRAQPFTGECPVNFDGQEVILEFGAPGGVERIASCETDIDPGHPVIVALVATVGDVVPIGLPD